MAPGGATTARNRAVHSRQPPLISTTRLVPIAEESVASMGKAASSGAQPKEAVASSIRDRHGAGMASTGNALASGGVGCAATTDVCASQWCPLRVGGTASSLVGGVELGS